MNKDNFTLIRVDEVEGHEDYWFKTDKESNEQLTKNYMEQGMIGVSEVVYAKDEDVVGIKRDFSSRYDISISNDKELHEILKQISV